MGLEEKIEPRRWANTGALFKEKRRELGYSQEKIARKLKSKREKISRVERGLIHPPRKQLRAWVRIFNVDNGEFLNAVQKDSKKYLEIVLGLKKNIKKSL